METKPNETPSPQSAPKFEKLSGEVKAEIKKALSAIWKRQGATPRADSSE